MPILSGRSTEMAQESVLGIHKVIRHPQDGKQRDPCSCLHHSHTLQSFVTISASNSFLFRLENAVIRLGRENCESLISYLRFALEIWLLALLV